MKWIIYLKIKASGHKYAFSVYVENGKNVFALAPFEDSGVVRGALVFDTQGDAEEHLRKQLVAAPNLMKDGIEFGTHAMMEPSEALNNPVGPLQ